jgi:CRP/FNR family transcriptional regulator
MPANQPVRRPPPSALRRLLAGLPPFADLDPALVDHLAQAARWASYDAGETIFWEGEAAPGVFLLHDGWLKVFKASPSGREQVIKFLGPGELFNEIGALADQPNPATAVALEPAGLWLIPRPALLSLLRDHPAIAQHLVRQLATRVLHLVELVADLSLRTVQGRLARLLLEDTTVDALQRPRWYTQAELAARLGTVPDVVQRALRSLAAQKLIEVERHQIAILDRAGLEEIAAE